MTADWPPTLLEGGICDPFCMGCLLCLLAAIWNPNSAKK